MKLKLKGCEHKSVEPYGDLSSQVMFHATCMGCYQRLRVPVDQVMHSNGRLTIPWVPDYAAPSCEHKSKKPVAAEITSRTSYSDAQCTDCGVIVRHPDGPGEWTEVLYNGYIIKEQW